MDFEGNEVRATQMYGGKRIRVIGTVNSIEVLKSGQSYPDLSLTSRWLCANTMLFQQITKLSLG